MKRGEEYNKKLEELRNISKLNVSILNVYGKMADLMEELISLDKNAIYEELHDGVTILELILYNNYLTKLRNKVIEIIKTANREEINRFVSELINFINELGKEEVISKDLLVIIEEVCKKDGEKVSELKDLLFKKTDMLDIHAFEYCMGKFDGVEGEKLPIEHIASNNGIIDDSFINTFITSYFYILYNTDQYLNVLSMNVLRDMCKRTGTDELFDKLMYMDTDLMDEDVMIYFLTKQNGKYPFELMNNVDREDFVWELINSYARRVEKSESFNPTLVNKLINISNEISNDSIRNKIADLMVAVAIKSKPSGYSNNVAMLFVGQNMPNVDVDEEFNELLAALNKYIHENPDYKYLLESFINTLYIAYMNDSPLVKFSLKVIIKGLLTGKLNPEVLYERGYYNSIKRNNTERKASAFYDPASGSMVFGDGQNTPFTLMHETGHLLHDVLDSLNLTKRDDFKVLLSSMKSRLDNSDLCKDFVNRYNELKDEIKDNMRVRIEQDEFFNSYFNNFDCDKIISSLNIGQEEYEIIKNSLSDEHKEKLIEKLKEDLIEEATQIYIEIYYPWFNAISDIIDAVYGGKSNMPYVHGSDYYLAPSSKFREMFANYYTLRCLCPRQYKKVKEILGEEFFEFMDTYMKELADSFDFGDDSMKKGGN